MCIVRNYFLKICDLNCKCLLLLFWPISFHIVNLAKVYLRSPEPSFYCYNFAPTGPIGKIQAPIRSSSNAAAIGVQKSLL